MRLLRVPSVERHVVAGLAHLVADRSWAQMRIACVSGKRGGPGDERSEEDPNMWLVDECLLVTVRQRVITMRALGISSWDSRANLALRE